LAGKWVGRSGDNDIILEFKVDGMKVTGTINNPLAGATPIMDGKLIGDDIFFYVVRTINNVESRVLWRGKAAGDEIKFKREIQGQEGSATDILAKKAK
jgi:hypothetical protein